MACLPPESRIVDSTRLARLLRVEQSRGRKVVFTNGVFDLLHPGHIRYLRAARAMGDLLVVALNTDESVRRLKGALRPILSQNERAKIIASMDMVDYVTFFGEDTPLRIIEELLPDILVKGGDYRPEDVVGKDVVEAHGGVVRTLHFVQGQSSTNVVQRILTAGSGSAPSNN